MYGNKFAWENLFSIFYSSRSHNLPYEFKIRSRIIVHLFFINLRNFSSLVKSSLEERRKQTIVKGKDN